MNESSPEPVLTIAIPTYNRREELLRTIAALIPGLEPRVRVVIIDNSSDYSVKDAVCGAFAGEITDRFIFHRNSANLGGGPNVLRCFEAAETDWIWVLGDDDFPLRDAIRTALGAIAEYPAAVGINFVSNILEINGYTRMACTVSETVGDLAGDLDCFGNLLFVSTNVYRREPMVAQLRIGYLQLQSWGPHVSMLLSALQGDCGPMVLHPARLVNWKRAESGTSWDYETVARQLPELVSVIGDVEIRSKFREKNEISHPRRLLANCNVFSELKRMTALSVSRRHLCAYVCNIFHDLYIDLVYSDKNLFFSTLKAFLVFPLLVLGQMIGPCYLWYRVLTGRGSTGLTGLSAPRSWARKDQDRL